MKNKPILKMKNITKTFPGVKALSEVNLELFSGEIHSLMGENGAGKSTLIKIISGVYQFDSGEYYLNDNLVNISTPIDAIEKGISVIYQELSVIDSLTVTENILFNSLPKTKLGRIKWKEAHELAKEILKEVGLNIDPSMKLERLSTAQKQLVEIARAISSKAKVIIMDEPTSALSPKEIEFLFTIIEKLKNNKVSILYVSHKMDEIFKISDKITVFRDGQYITTKLIHEFTEESLIATMVGRKLNDLYPKRESNIGEIAFEVNNFSTDDVKNINFYVRKGEVVGFSGLMGAGRSELAMGLFGAKSRLEGSILLDGKNLPKDNPTISRKLGLGFVTEDRKKNGIFSNLTVKENMLISSLRQYKKGLSQDTNLEKEIVMDEIKKFRIKTPSPFQMIVNLSGGNQQKILISRWLINQDLKVLIIDEPTRGIDVGAKKEIYQIINELSERGLAIIIISSEMPEIIGMSDRVYVMKDGKITAEYLKEDMTQEKIMKSSIQG